MESALYVALSAQVALEKRLNSVARNVANAGTTGYRAEGIRFSSVMSSTAAQQEVAYASPGETFISRRAGGLTQTGNPLDVAVRGDGWLSVMAAGGPVYTRDGRFTMLETGELVSVNGDPVLDVGGAPILLNPNGSPPEIAEDGMITQDGQQFGALGLFSIDEGAGLTRQEGAGVIPDTPATPILDFTENGIVQGFLEGSNVDPMLELVKLITIQRSFESAAQAIEQSEGSVEKAIRTLGEA